MSLSVNQFLLFHLTFLHSSAFLFRFNQSLNALNLLPVSVLSNINIMNYFVL